MRTMSRIRMIESGNSEVVQWQRIVISHDQQRLIDYSNFLSNSIYSINIIENRKWK